MPKIIDYPRASLQNSLELARSVDSLGGECDLQTTAEKSGRKLSGAFSALTSGAAKYGFVSTMKGRISTTELFREHKLAYTPADAELVLRKAFLNIPVFAKIYEKFRGNSLPIEIFDKLLIREFGVSDADASRVAGYFLDGAKISGLLKDDKLISSSDSFGLSSGESSQPDQQLDASSAKSNPSVVSVDLGAIRNSTILRSDSENFNVRISGPGMDSVIHINELDDLAIVEVMLRKVARQLSASIEAKKKPSTETADG